MSHAEPLETTSLTISPLIQLTNDFLGGKPVLRKMVRDEKEAHLLIEEGIPARAMLRVMKELQFLNTPSVLVVLGMSPRNFQRRKAAAERNPKTSLTLEEGSRLWKFTELLAKATQVLGSKEAAEKWLSSPQIGLDRRRPMDLLTTIPGAEMVGDLLTRMEFDVYT